MNLFKHDIEKYVYNIEIISNNKKITAIKNKNNNIEEYIFWEKGKIGDLEVDNPCTLIISGNELFISDPTQKIDFININFGQDNFKVRLRKGYTTKINIKNI